MEWVVCESNCKATILGQPVIQATKELRGYRLLSLKEQSMAMSQAMDDVGTDNDTNDTDTDADTDPLHTYIPSYILNDIVL